MKVGSVVSSIGSSGSGIIFVGSASDSVDPSTYTTNSVVSSGGSGDFITIQRDFIYNSIDSATGLAILVPYLASLVVDFIGSALSLIG